MKFCEKLSVLRKNKGYTQEILAEKMDVSRQAVAKWESGEAYPDIHNLIIISDVFGVTIDNLIKDETCIKDNVNKEKQEDFIDFLIEAKKHTYAGKGNESVSSRPMSHDLQYKDKNKLYIDSYLGGENFSGEEAVWIDEKPVWAMNYTGRVLGDNFSGDFLKFALLGVSREMPYRGPCAIAQNDYSYRCSVKGNIDWFIGSEEILYKNVKVYECNFHGGKIK